MTAFPRTPLPVSALIAPGANPVDPTSFLWTDVTSSVRVENGIQIRAGRQDEGSLVDATSVQATVDNGSGNFSTRNPMGTWFGSLSRGTPIQAQITRINDQFARTVASGLGTDTDSGIAWSAGSVFAVNGAQATVTLGANVLAAALPAGVGSADFDAQYTSWVSAVPVGAAFVHAVAFWYGSGSDYYRAHTEFQTSGLIAVKVQHHTGAENDVIPLVVTSVAFAANTKIRTRVQLLGSIIRIKVWLASGSEPVAWNLQASMGAAQYTGLAAGLAAWAVGGITTIPVGFIEDFRFDAIRATTPVPEWPPRWDQSGNDATAPVVGAGPLRRLSQGQSALRSPMYRQVTRYTDLVGHWPLEDDSSATQLTNSLGGGVPGTVSGTTLAVAGGPPGAMSVAQSAAGSIMSGAFVAASTTAGWQIAWSCKLAAAAPAAQTEMIRWTTSNGYQWSWQVSSAAFRILVTAGGSTLLDATVLFGAGVDPTQFVQYRCKVHVSGGTVTVERAWFTSTGVGPFGITDTFSGSIGCLTGWKQTTNTATQDALWSHIYGVTTNGDDLQSYAAIQSFLAYTGETAGDRAVRLAAEEGVPIQLIGTASSTPTMGAQSAATLLDLLHECEAVDQGVLHERGGALAYRTRVSLYNQAPIMALDFSSGHIAAPPEPTDDDQRLRNLIKLSRKGGSEVTVSDDGSVALNGVYSDELTVNLGLDADLTNQAGWRLHLGTLDELRWPRLELDLARNPSLIGAWCQVQVGSRITIAHPPATAITGAGLDLIVEGWTETFSSSSWDVVLVCSPASAYTVGVYGSSSSRYDSASTTLSAGVSAGATTLVLSTANLADAWSTAAGSQPYDLLISGERITVPVGGMSAVSGTGPYAQTVTGATRAVNGVSKALPTGVAVHVATPARYAL